ncbi:response regulator [Nocardioides sp. SYSU D00038]|uniref:response regulator n=1 Tax=Nocardioides sp. SYSU D00038 TaxID=2812554 RepID=UPI001967CA22|nr:response regulator [Nocardioides sp. SYSU D00038]
MDDVRERRTSTSPARLALVAGLALAAPGVAVFWLLPGTAVSDAAYLAIGTAAAVAACFGAWRFTRPVPQVSWLLAAGLCVYTVGDWIWSVLSWSGASVEGYTWADAAYLPSYGLFALALALAVIRASPGRRGVDVDALLDVVSVVVVGIVVLGSLTEPGSGPNLGAQLVDWLVLASYPVMDAVMLALALRVVLTRASRSLLGSAAIVALGLWLLADVTYLVADYTGTVGSTLDSLWTVAAVTLAASTFRGHVAGSSHESRPPDNLFTALLIANLPLLTPVVVLVLQVALDRETSTPGVVAMLVAVTALALLRTARVLAAERSARVELAAARDAALAGTRAKSAFLATMSHEIRTPLNGVIGLTALLRDTELDARQRQYVEALGTAGDSLLNLINDVLDFSKVEAGKLVLEQVDLDVATVVEEAAELVTEAAREKGLELLVHCDPGLPSVVRGDPHRLRQVLLNLAGNAIKFTAEGEVVLRARAAGPDVLLEVSDTGAGIAPDEVAALFEPFTQADTSTTREFGGTGLGLAISRMLVTAMRGEIGVRSRPGEGSTFWFRLPLERVTQPQPAADPTLVGARVLVVDDNAVQLAALDDLLGAWGARVTTSGSGGDAWRSYLAAAADGAPYDAVVVDRAMPGMDGLDLARRIAEAEQPAPTVLLTTGPSDAHPSRVHAVVTKPVTRARLHAALHDALGSRTQVDAPARRGARPPARGHVLVVEDDAANRLVASGLLDQLGYSVEVVESGSQALAAVLGQQFDAILMDCHLPGIDGLATTRRVRAIQTGVRTPVVAVTADTSPGFREECLAAGMDDYLAKPVDAAALEAVLVRWVTAGGADRAERPHRAGPPGRKPGTTSADPR